MFGGNVHTCVYCTIAGLDTAVNGSTAGWAHILYKPAAAVMERLGSAAATITTRFGNASISWAYSASMGTLALNASVPAGATAEVHVPQLQALGGKAITVADGAAQVWKAGVFVPGTAGVEAGGVVADKWAPVPTVVLQLASGTFILSASK